jgi:hypothetical protein
MSAKLSLQDQMFDRFTFANENYGLIMKGDQVFLYKLNDEGGWEPGASLGSDFVRNIIGQRVKQIKEINAY